MTSSFYKGFPHLEKQWKINSFDRNASQAGQIGILFGRAPFLLRTSAKKGRACLPTGRLSASTRYFASIPHAKCFANHFSEAYLSILSFIIASPKGVKLLI